MINREAWFHNLITELNPLFTDRGATIPEKTRISVGFPSKKAFASKGRVIGQCWYPEACEDGSTNIFIHPVLHEPILVSATVVHELVHACLGSGHGHQGQFIELSKAVGLVKPWTATTPGEGLIKELDRIVEKLGEYPHSKLDAIALSRLAGPKQTTRLVKVACVECGCPVRMTRQWIEKGLPACACGGVMEVAV